jgi:hypothetical protein
VCWCYLETCRRLCPALIETRPTTPRAYDFEKWGRQFGTIVKNHAHAVQGDIVIFNFSHVGIAVQKYSALLGIPCVEGNTDKHGTNEGEGVWLKNRSLSSVRSIVRIHESTTPQTA